MSTTIPFAYNTGSTIDGTTQVGSLAVGTTEQEYSGNLGGVPWWMGADEQLGYVIAHPVPSNTQPTPIPGVFASLGFDRTKDFLDSSFISLAEYVSKKYSTPQTFTSAPEASIWLTNNGFWNSYVAPVLYLDSGNPSSYPGSGTTWYDISNNNNGTLQNGITYSPSYSGILEFNSVNAQYVSFSSPQNIPVGNSQYTINTWFRANSNGTLGIIGWGNWGSYNEVNALRLGNNLLINYWWGNDLAVSYSYNVGQWYNLCVTFDGINRTMYLDGIQVGQDSPGLPNVGSSSNMQVGTTNGSEYFNGSIPIVSVYPYAITSGEVLSNYNTIYPRFI